MNHIAKVSGSGGGGGAGAGGWYFVEIYIAACGFIYPTYSKWKPDNLMKQLQEQGIVCGIESRCGVEWGTGEYRVYFFIF